MTVFTVDVSNHDWSRRGGPLDWKSVGGSGIAASCAKVSEGDRGGVYSYTDPYGPMQVAAAGQWGLLSGAYHVLSRGDDASVQRQVDWLASFRADWYMIDVEPFSELASRKIAPTWSDVQRFDARWAQVTGRPLAVYLPRWVWSGNLGSPNISSLRGPLVSSDYGSNTALAPAPLYSSRGGDSGPGWQAYGGKTPELWQFGSAARVAGASGATDVNAYRGTPQQLHTRLTGEDVPLVAADKTIIATAVREVLANDGYQGSIGLAYQVLSALRDGTDVTPGAGGAQDPGGNVPVWAVTVLKAAAARGDANSGSLAELGQALAAAPDAIATQVLQNIGAHSVDDIVSALRATLSNEKLAALKSAL